MTSRFYYFSHLRVSLASFLHNIVLICKLIIILYVRVLLLNDTAGALTIKINSFNDKIQWF